MQILEVIETEFQTILERHGLVQVWEVNLKSNFSRHEL